MARTTWDFRLSRGRGLATSVAWCNQGGAWQSKWAPGRKGGIRLSALSAIECAAYVVGQEMTRDERGENRTERKCREADKCAET